MGISGLSLSPAASPTFHSSTTFSASISPSTWFLDSGAFNHMISLEQNLQDPQAYVGHKTITIENGQQMPISGIGSIELSIAYSPTKKQSHHRL